MAMPSKFTNRLIHESSPYLLQHAHNPVDWHPWNEDTLAKARSLDRMLLISIGYAACHWCHVMEKESFMDDAVAKTMNRYFVCIKVDREERPDVDQVYMNAIQLITGGGGWPLNCFALPDGRPFFGGTYFRKDQWLQLLENVHLLYKNRRKELEEQAASLTNGVASSDIIPIQTEESGISTRDMQEVTKALKIRFDLKEGGMMGAPKFPMPTVLSYLLRSHYYDPDEEVEHFLKTSLKKMAFGGIYDQIGGGFARYSTDSHWKVPHFEKMLYDNAQLVSLYSNAWQVWKDPLYQETVDETLSFIIREMTHPSGGFFSSLDADSEGVEGKYYTWGVGEFKQVLESQADTVGRFYQLGDKGLWEDGKNILLRALPADEFALQVGLQPSQFKNILKSARSKLMKFRQKRIRPALDDKILASWNGLMMNGFVQAYRAFNKKDYLDAAIKNADFLTSEMMDDNGRLFHGWKNEKAYINGFLEDYCFLADGLLSLYQVTLHQLYLDHALGLAEYAIKHFYDKKKGLFYVTSSLDPPLIARKAEVFDNVIPSSNSTMAKVLFLLGLAFERDDLSEISRRMLMNMADQVSKYPSAYTHWANAMLNLVFPFHTLAITGKDSIEKLKKINKAYHPNVFCCGSDKEGSLPILQNRYIDGETLLYLCTGKECRMPTNSVEEILKQLPIPAG
jgi:uncharacterized protein YyaL (SSP411 family)